MISTTSEAPKNNTETILLKVP